MVKVALIGATGKSGTAALAELLLRGHKVTAIVRDPSKLQPAEGLKVLKADILSDPLAPLFEGVDVVINAYAPPLTNVNELPPVTKKILEAVKEAGIKRFIMVGGAGSLLVGEELVVNQPWFPAEYKDIAFAHIEAFDIVKASEVNWTMLSPPGLFANPYAPSEKTGVFRIGTDSLIMDETGKSTISVEDFAVVIVNEIENPQFEGKRFTCGY